ncbi:MAG: cell division protein FtsQ/DivIB [Caryophanon sp.]|nr:cell division protein FtsQ/DivIB [Caryophanon sp.]
MAEKVIDLENRIPQLARRKRRRFIRQISFIALLIILLVLIIAYRQSDWSRIQTIEVIGADYKTVDYHVEQLPFHVGDSMWFDVDDMEQAALENNWLKQVTIERDWLTHVVVTIEEYKHVGYVKRDEQYYPILENGEIVPEAMTSFVMDAPLLTNFKDDAYLTELLEQLAQLDDEVHALISQITYTPSNSDNSVVTLYMTDGYEVRALIYDFAAKVNYYPSIVKQLGDIDVKGIIDLEVGSYFTSFDAEYGIRIDESTYMEEAEPQSEEAAEPQQQEDSSSDESSAEEQSYGAIITDRFV